jgi:hypothetical protein
LERSIEILKQVQMTEYLTKNKELATLRLNKENASCEAASLPRTFFRASLPRECVPHFRRCFSPHHFCFARRTADR